MKRRAILLAAAVSGAMSIALPARAQQQPDADARPVLEQLNREMQTLLSDVQTGVVRVQLPPPIWLREIAVRENPVNRWPDLDAPVKKKLEEAQNNARSGQYNLISAEVTPTTRPATQATSNPASDGRVAAAAPTTRPLKPGERLLNFSMSNGNVVVESQGVGGQQIMVLTPEQMQQGKPFLQVAFPRVVTTNNIGILLDSQGHLMVPLFVEREAIGNNVVRVSFSDGAVTTAHYLGSDRQTNMTVLQVDEQQVKHWAKFTSAKPAQGSMVIVMAPNSAFARLTMWTGGQADYGVVAGTDGAISGVVRFGQFLSIKAAKPVIEQLISTGRVKRPVVGLLISDVRADDPMRQMAPNLATKPAIRVHTVFENSPAAKAGIQPGDLILNVDGSEVGDTPTFAAAMSAAGEHSTFHIMRGGKTVDLPLDFAPAEDNLQPR